MTVSRAAAAGAMKGYRAAAAGAVLAVLAGCGGSDWAKAGADEATVAGEYQDCRGLADTAVKTDADIDQDILATRGSDWRRGGTGQVQTRTMREHTRDRGAAVVDACMRAKGFFRAP